MITVLDGLRKRVTGPLKLFFLDEMRYGMMTNLRRSWGRRGKRVIIPTQQEYVNAYLYSAIDPLTGDNVHLLGFAYLDTESTRQFLAHLQEEFPDTHNVIVWDNAPFHKSQILQQIQRLTLIALPSYSPKINPIERFFEEIRRKTANCLFESLDNIENLIESKIRSLNDDKSNILSIVGFEYIINQWNQLL